MTAFICFAGNSTDLGLSDCLKFFTGAELIPPVGFDVECTLNFNSSSVYPMASTCALILTLPSKYEDYTCFKEHMLFAFTNNGGFGLY